MARPNCKGKNPISSVSKKSHLNLFKVFEVLSELCGEWFLSLRIHEEVIHEKLVVSALRWWWRSSNSERLVTYPSGQNFWRKNLWISEELRHMLKYKWRLFWKIVKNCSFTMNIIKCFFNASLLFIDIFIYFYISDILVLKTVTWYRFHFIVSKLHLIIFSFK